MKSLLALALLLGTVQWVLSAPITLETAIREVCAKSDSSKMMEESAKKTKQMIREKYSAALPTLSTSLSAARIHQRGIGMQKDDAQEPIPASMANEPVTWGALGNMFGAFTKAEELSMYSSSIQLSQPIYTFGKIGTAVDIAKQFDQSAQAGNARNLQQLQLLALDVFFQVRLSEMALDVSRNSLARKKELSEFLKRNFDLGSGNKAYLLSTQADLNGQHSDIINAEERVRASRMRLNVLMGRDLAAPLELDTSLAMPAVLALPAPSETEAVASAVDKRNDLKAMDFLAEANRGGAKIYNAMYLPSIGLNASLGMSGTEPEDVGDWDRRNWTVGVGLQWTLFDGLASRAKARQYQSDARKLEIARDGMAKMAEIEVRTALAECAAADSNSAASREMLASAREAYEITSENFRQGGGQFSDLQLAEERLSQAELNGVNARYRLIRSRAALRVSMGLDIVNVEAGK